MPEREHLVVVVPGIGGSMLALPGRPDELVWSAGLRDVGDVLRNPGRLSLGEHPVLDPVGLIPTRKAFGVWTAIRGYDGLLAKLAALPGAVVDDGTPAGRRLDATVVAVPYDFRRSIAEAAQRLDDEIRQRLACLWPADSSGTPRVLVVAHSLGGLVARYWAAQQDNWALCRALITLGTPHRGTPKALDVLANGIGLGPWRITRPVEVLRGWPSMAELLPRYPAVADLSAPSAPSAPSVSPGSGRAEVFLHPHELPVDWLAGPACEAFAVHQQIESGWAKIPRDGPEMIPRIGYGHGTLRGCTFDGRRIRVSGDLAAGHGLGRWADDLGDGTVPAYSGLPLEMDRHSPRGLRVAARHAAIAELDEVVELLETYEGRPPELPTRGEEHPAVLGLDIAELQPAGELVPVAAAIRGVPADVSGVPVWATVTTVTTVTTSATARADVGAPRVVRETRLDWDSATGTFRGKLTALAPGVYRVALSAEEVPAGGNLAAEETVEALDGAGLA